MKNSSKQVLVVSKVIKSGAISLENHLLLSLRVYKAGIKM